MRTDLIDWQIRQEADGAWLGAAPGLSVWLEGDGGLMATMAASGLVEPVGAPSGRQDLPSPWPKKATPPLCMDRAVHQVRTPGSAAVKEALRHVEQAISGLRIAVNLADTTIAEVQGMVGGMVSACRDLEQAARAALVAAHPGAPELVAAVRAAAAKAAQIGREIGSYAGVVADRLATGEAKPWADLALEGGSLMVRAIEVGREIDSIGYQYEERWLVAKLDGVYVYLAAHQGRLHVFVSKQKLSLNAERPPKVA